MKLYVCTTGGTKEKKKKVAKPKNPKDCVRTGGGRWEEQRHKVKQRHPFYYFQSMVKLNS